MAGAHRTVDYWSWYTSESLSERNQTQKRCFHVFGTERHIQVHHACLPMILTSEWFIFFSLFLSQKGCFIPKKSRDGWLGLSDEKLVSWRRKYDLPCGMQLFDENFLFQFFPNIECHCPADKFTSFHNFEASNQLNPIRIGCFPAFAFYARFLSSSCIHLEIILAKDESPKNFRNSSIEVSRHSVGLTGKIYVHSGTSTWIFYLMV